MRQLRALLSPFRHPFLRQPLKDPLLILSSVLPPPQVCPPRAQLPSRPMHQLRARLIRPVTHLPEAQLISLPVRKLRALLSPLRQPLLRQPPLDPLLTLSSKIPPHQVRPPRAQFLS